MKLTQALVRRIMALAAAFAFGVSAAMLWVYHLPDEELGSDRFDLVPSAIITPRVVWPPAAGQISPTSSLWYTSIGSV